MFGEAVVFSNLAIAQDFRYLIKQHGGMLAKGWLLGVQFATLMENDLYFSICRHANEQADAIRQAVKDAGYSLLAETTTNQVFPILPDALLERLKEKVTFTEQGRVNETSRAVRFCTSWATTDENVALLCNAIREDY
jgi:threonine aldolase